MTTRMLKARTCSKGHEEITHHSKTCPVCAWLKGRRGEARENPFRSLRGISPRQRRVYTKTSLSECALRIAQNVGIDINRTARDLVLMGAFGTNDYVAQDLLERVINLLEKAV